jgi:Uma2 family endonuclease
VNLIPTAPAGPIFYPDSDGQPMAENTRQLRWIVLIYSNLMALFRGVADIFIATDLLWYPVEGHPEIRTAPDVLAAFGRPTGDRGSYKQWEEDNVPLTVVFEVLSPGNTPIEMAEKFTFYEEHGVEEYYIYDPDSNHLLIYVRRGEVLRRVRPPHGFISPRLGIRFDLSGPEMVIYRPDGQPFRPLDEVDDLRRAAEQQAHQERQRAEQAQQRAEQAQRQAEQERQRATRLVELGRKARRGQASPEELAELERLEQQNGPPEA